MFHACKKRNLFTYIQINMLSQSKEHPSKKRRVGGEETGFEVLTWAREGLWWSKCSGGSCHIMHHRAGDAGEEVGVAVVQPNTDERTEQGAI